MIGVISKESDRATVREFFELFKTPWEFYREDGKYEVIISDGCEVAPSGARLVVLYGSGQSRFDSERGLERRALGDGLMLEGDAGRFPVYGRACSFQGGGRPVLRVPETGEAAGVLVNERGRDIVRMGYDLFEEAKLLLSSGQPAKYASIPTAEMHISLLRRWIVDCGVPLVEIPPFPLGYNFIACLTHDVDFMGIRDHGFDHSVAGFAIRALVPSRRRDFRGRIPWLRYIKNWKALLSLPGVYLGLSRDFWFDLDRYLEIEDGTKSTFFFIPFADYPGDGPGQGTHRYRAARYDIAKYRKTVERLVADGHEVGLHGLDAWHDPGKGRRELQVIREVAGGDDVGVRIHWLFFSDRSPVALEEGGFCYDSSVGYNETVGFRSGTTQAFLLPGTSRVFELPMNVMDTALFYGKRMNLCEAEALRLCEGLIRQVRSYGGVFTVNWHTRSLSPERNWDEFYLELLRMLREQNAWLSPAGGAVKWFKARRSIRFDDVEYSRNKVRASLRFDGGVEKWKLFLRVHVPRESAAGQDRGGLRRDQAHVDIPISGEPVLEAAI